MIWTDSPSWITCWNDGNNFIRAMQHPDIEFVLCQHPWIENDALFADVLLPVNTKLEEDDIGCDVFSGQMDMLYPQPRCIEPLGESFSDYEIVCKIAERLGLLEEYTGGMTVPEIIQRGLRDVPVSEHITWEEWLEKGYYVVPPDARLGEDPRRLLSSSTKTRRANPLQTPTGKLEFYSTGLAEHFPDDPERPPVPHWIPEGESHQETIGTERSKKYPLLVMSNHPRWGVHSQHDDVTWFREIETCKIRASDGYQYHPLWMNPADAAARGIKHGDVVSHLQRTRGRCLPAPTSPSGSWPERWASTTAPSTTPSCRARSTGAASSTPSCRATPRRKNTVGMAVSGFLVEVEKADLEALQPQVSRSLRPRVPHRGGAVHRGDSAVEASGAPDGARSALRLIC